MGKINNEDIYIVDTNISDLDNLIGSDGNTEKKVTKNFNIGMFKSFVLSGLTPENGGVLRFTEITYTGSEYSLASEVLNNLGTPFIVERYHIVVVSLNGEKSMFKQQGVTVGEGNTPVLQSDFIVFPVSVGAKGDDGVGINTVIKTGTAGLIDTYTITYSDATTSTFTVTNGINGTNGTNGATGPQGASGTNGTNGANGVNGKGITSITKTSTSGVIDTYTITYSDSTTSTFTVTNGTKGNDGAQGPAGTSSSNNLQKTITGDYLLTDTDNNYVIFIDNGATAVSIEIPSTGLREKFNVGFYQLGTGDVAIVEALGVSILNPIGNKIKGQKWWAYLERFVATQTYALTGNTKA